MSSLFTRNTSTKATVPFQDDIPLPLTAAQLLEKIAGWPDLKAADAKRPDALS